MASNEIINRRLVGFYGELNLAYKNMLYLGVTARQDLSSTLPQSQYAFFYPSVNASFVFSELLKNSGTANFLNYGKLRASWASVGNDADPYLLATYFVKTDIIGGFGSTTFPFNGIPGYSLSDRIGNSDIKPEKTQAFEVGTELGFLNNRISLDFSYYQNRSKDQIIAVPIAASSGYASKVINAGEVENKGVELTLRGTPIKTADWTWEVYGTYTHNRNKVISLIDGVDQLVIGGFGGMSIVAAVGKPYGTFYTTDLRKDAEGRVVINPDNGLPYLSEQAQYLGSYNPKWQGSLGTNVTYKSFSFNVLFDTKQGGKFYSRTKDIMDFVGTAKETAVGNREEQIFPNSVYPDNDGKSVVNTEYLYYPQTYFSSQIPAGQHVLDASYIKLREVSLTYRIPKQVLNRTFLGDASVGVFGNNLWLKTASNNKYADPEINSGGATNEQGLDFTAQPSLRNFGFNLRVTF
ncbi:TonB-dependent receptor [Chitinophaga sedimenti]|uniref:TonB-dependent receptor domain-containing protein n=1 Tax=Chitinophaga sedimenti TaxID=2033606 RepID=UPI0020039EB1|nr:TonB-dependent receptor [Chitinophaga sedimenti]MCK7558923.1 TonB-dependent receptor [Chitinophaga sedimenti]